MLHLTHTAAEFLYRIKLLRKFLGYSLLLVSCIAWAALPAIPFLPLETTEKAQWGGGLFIFAEITWWAAMPLLGKEVIDLCKLWWFKIRAWPGVAALNRSRRLQRRITNNNERQ